MIFDYKLVQIGLLVDHSKPDEIIWRPHYPRKIDGQPDYAAQYIKNCGTLFIVIVCCFEWGALGWFIWFIFFLMCIDENELNLRR